MINCCLIITTNNIFFPHTEFCSQPEPEVNLSAVLKLLSRFLDKRMRRCSH